MQKQTWSLITRLLNLVSSFVLIGFQLWFAIEMIIICHKNGQRGQIVVRIFAPLFLL